MRLGRGNVIDGPCRAAVHSLFPPGLQNEALPAIHVSGGGGGGGGTFGGTVEGGGDGGFVQVHVNAAYYSNGGDGGGDGGNMAAYLNPHLPPDAEVVTEHPVVPPRGGVARLCTFMHVRSRFF